MKSSVIPRAWGVYLPLQFTGNISKITAGANQGRIGIIIQIESHAGSHDIVRLKDTAGNTFATRAKNVFVIGKGSKSYISLPKGWFSWCIYVWWLLPWENEDFF